MASPTAVSILTFQVGFGDAFLLRFHYPDGSLRHVLVDFGSYPKAPWLVGEGMRKVAQAIQRECGGSLQGLVATHRHADHISGFTHDADDPGAVIAACAPEVVVQPWTEDPDIRRNARRPPAFLAGITESGPRKRALSRVRAFVESLDSLEALLPVIEREAGRLRGLHEDDMAGQLMFHGENGLKNRSAVENLMAMGAAATARYVHHGADSGLGAVLPGVKVTVLGPPTLEQTSTIKRYAKKAPDQYWLTLTGAALKLASDRADGFPEKAVSHKDAPAYARWLIRRLRSLRGHQLLEIVRTLDRFLNNTSVILLFEFGGKKLLFPGDAQLENWMYALEQPGADALLADVDFYKVGHHGSLNATPRLALYEKFTRRGQGLRSAVSTLEDVHGGEHGNPTEVPRIRLMDKLRAEAALFSTQSLPKQPGVFNEIRIDV